MNYENENKKDGCSQNNNNYIIIQNQTEISNNIKMMKNAKKEVIKWRRLAGELSCKLNQDDVGPTGGWCLKPSHEDWGKFGKSAVNHVPPDKGIARAILKFLNDETKLTSIVDVGAGIGQYGHWLRETKANIKWTGYDGAENVEEFTDGFVKWTDVTDPLFDNIVEIGDWVMSLEVGEHIPSEKTSNFIALLNKYNEKGIILSWGIPGQGGHSHINLKTNEEVIQLLKDNAYHQDQWCLDFQNYARQESDYFWFKGSFMVFKRKTFDLNEI